MIGVGLRRESGAKGKDIPQQQRLLRIELIPGLLNKFSTSSIGWKYLIIDFATLALCHVGRTLHRLYKFGPCAKTHLLRHCNLARNI
jgi:hypothetical protein